MIRTTLLLVRDALHFVTLACSSQKSLAAKNLFLRKQLAFYVERKVKPRRLNDAARIALVVLAGLLDWRQLLVVVRPATLVRWHRQGFRLYWRWKSRSCPADILHLPARVVVTAADRLTWAAPAICLRS